jgi:hypothetical protein
MGSCIEVVKQKKICFLLKKNVVSCIQNQNGHFSVLGIRKIINSLPLRRKLLRNFLLRVRSNNIRTKCGNPVSMIIIVYGSI